MCCSRWTLGRLAIILVALAVTASLLHAQPTPQFPVIIKDRAQLRALGISIETSDSNKPTLQHACYNYGDGGYYISVTDELLARYKAKGFSLQSLCLGLVSEALFDPESGKRLPTYVLFDVERLKRGLAEIEGGSDPLIRKFRGKDPEKLTADELLYCCSEDKDITSELPLVLPTCFKHGNPYSDCTWRYAIKSGERLSDASVEKFRNLGRAIEAGMKRAIELAASHARGRKPAGCAPDSGDWPCLPASERDELGYLGSDSASVLLTLNETLPRIDPESRPLPPALLKGQNLSFIDVSPAFPRGFGYALNADGSAGPGASKSALRHAAGGGGPRSQVSTTSLRKMIED